MSLEDSRDWYRALAEDIPVLVTRVSADGIVTYVNEASAKLVGRSREEIVGTDFFQLAPLDYREQIKKAFASLTSCNDAACRLYGGYSREELLGTSYDKLYCDPEEAFRTFNQVYTTGKPEKGLVLEMILQDGSIAFGELSISPMTL